MADVPRQRMRSPEGEGNAKSALESAWEAYYKTNKAVNKRIFSVLPELRAALKGQTGARLLDIFGFWLIWRLCGGFDGTQKALGISKAQMYRRIALFREAFGEHPDVFELPGVDIDPAVFAAGMAERQKRS